MNIVSYRGPGSGGGVSPTLSFLFDKQNQFNSHWYFIDQFQLVQLGRLFKNKNKIAGLSPELIDRHYRYCNEFLWPIMHDMPEYATFRHSDRANYFALNRIIAAALAQADNEWSFINDYQLAVVPALMASLSHSDNGSNAFTFWHIPWPKHVLPQHVQALSEIARGMLASQMLGFHTHEYTDNFLNFVCDNLPEFQVDLQNRQVSPARAVDMGKKVKGHLAIPDRLSYMNNQINVPTTDILVAPLGIAIDEWQALAARNTDIAQTQFASLSKTPFILSVDRADYTKGVKERLQAIETFFNQHPQWKGKVTFVQICTPTRPGLYAFDSYFLECKDMAAELREHFGDANWQPLVWIENTATAEELACLYRHATAMLVSPIRDGLNLTAKEYVACQNGDPGILLLSANAGAWHELRPGCLSINPQDSNQMSQAIATALTLNEKDRQLRLSLMKQSLKQNSLSKWWGQLQRVITYKQLQQGKATAGMV